MKSKEMGRKWWREKKEGDLPLHCAARGGNLRAKQPTRRRPSRVAPKPAPLLLIVTLMPVKYASVSPKKNSWCK